MLCYTWSLEPHARQPRALQNLGSESALVIRVLSTFAHGHVLGMQFGRAIELQACSFAPAASQMSCLLSGEPGGSLDRVFKVIPGTSYHTIMV